MAHCTPRDKKRVEKLLRDPRRCFTGPAIAALLQECFGRCSHPLHRFCDVPYLTLRAHHIIFHARGGRTRTENGLMLCDDCHDLLHSGTMPLRFVYSIKQSLRDAGLLLGHSHHVCPESLLNEIARIQRSPLTSGDKFALLNDVLIDANYLTSERGRILVFAHAFLAKAAVLNDGTPPVRASLDWTLASMEQRRAWAAMLAGRAARYARRIGDDWLRVRGRHVVAVCYNARSRFARSVSAHRVVLRIVDGVNWEAANRDAVELFRARIVREMGVCMAKTSGSEDVARSSTQDSLTVARAVGTPGDIDDALVRCCEADTFVGNLPGARRRLDKLYSNWHRMKDNLRAITLKLDARLGMASGDRKSAEDLVSRGAAWCNAHGIHHQSYHFARLNWNIERGLLTERIAYLT